MPFKSLSGRDFDCTNITLTTEPKVTRQHKYDYVYLFQNESPGPGSYGCISCPEIQSPSFSKKGTTGFVPSKVRPPSHVRWFQSSPVPWLFLQHHQKVYIFAFYQDWWVAMRQFGTNISMMERRWIFMTSMMCVNAYRMDLHKVCTDNGLSWHMVHNVGA